MRKRLLFSCFALCLCAYGLAMYGLSAWNWLRAGVEVGDIPSPLRATQPISSAWLAPENDVSGPEDGQYLLRNVATGKYWGAANSWGTQASLTDNPDYVVLTALEDGTYQLESQVNNGETAYYFNGDYMDNGTPVALTISKQANGHYTISNGAIYYGYDGNSTVLGKTETDPTAPNVQWDIISVETATAALASATADAPQNATFLIADANFGRNNRYYDQWTFEASNQDNNGNVTNFCVESWHAVFTMSQTINVPNGVYGLTAQGFYRQDGTDYEHLPVFFLNNETVPFPKMAGVENSMSDASSSFSEGKYTINPIYVTVTDGTLTLGARLEENTRLWCIWDNFTLMCYGPEANIAQMKFESRFTSLVDNARQWRQTEGVTAEGQHLLDDALAAYATITANTAEDEQLAVETQLNDAIQYAEAGNVLVVELTTAYDLYGTKLAATGSENDILMALLNNIDTALSNHVFESNNQIETWLSDLKAFRLQYYPYEYRYWFDYNSASTFEGVSNNAAWHIEADLSGLSESLHAIHIQVKYAEGDWSAPVTHYFEKKGTLADFSYRIWTESDLSKIFSGSLTGQPIELDVSTLMDGLHTLHVQVTSSQGASIPSDRLFIKIPQTEGIDNITCLMFIDDKFYRQENVETSNGVVEWSLDVSDLTLGLHNYMLQVITPSGAASITQHGFFIRDTKRTEYQALQCYYMVDGDAVISQAGEISEGTYHFNLDVSSLSDGLHRLSYWLADDSGVMTETKSTFFTKIPLGGYGINLYEYWLNESFDTRVQTTVEPRQEKLNIISLLPVETQPLRSSNFQFAFKNNSPIIYAKNEFHIRFHDASGRFTETVKEYVDEKVSQNVEPVGELQETQTFDRVEENDIRWYTVTLEEGDSIAFKSNQACTMQLFAPSGEEVYAASGPNSVVYDGRNTKENGTYYLAVHDVMGSQSQMTLEYEHIDKYALLSYTPDTIGVIESHVEMFIEGNGYDKLKSVTLRSNSNIIQADSIYVVSKGKAIVRFSFLGTEMCDKYDLLLKFKDGEVEDSIVCTEAITLKEEEMADIIVQVKSSPQVGYPYPVTISLTNPGNVSMLYVPFNIACTFDLSGWRATAKPGQSAWASLSLMNFSLVYREDYNPENNEYYTPYNPFTLSYNLFGTGIPGMVIHIFIPVLGPHETKDFVVGFIGSGHAKFNLYAWTGVPMNSKYDDTEEETNIYSVWKYLKEFQKWKSALAGNQAPRRAPLDHAGTVGDALDVADAISDCIPGRMGNAASAGVGLARIATALGLVGGGIENGLRLQGIDAYTQGDYLAESILQDYKESLQQNMPTPGQIADIAGLPNWESHLSELQDRQASCSNPMPDAHEIEIWAPGDPNDIFGYKAPSDSKAVAKGITEGYYTIEFENDPELANAAAHKIVVKDTLDSKTFDLSTFEPTSIKIGNVETKINKETRFPFTVDLRPRINVIGQVNLDYDKEKGIATWTITSLDPMKMEETNDAMQGVLPVNVDGNGQGEIAFNIRFRDNLDQGTEIANRASIVFDNEKPIMTPTWVNIVDKIAPTSHVSACEIKNDTTVTLNFESDDELSGVWKYDVYVQYGKDASWKHAGSAAVDSTFDVRIYEGINHGFYVVATDSAGNVEAKEAAREYTLDLFEPTEGSELALELAEGWNWISHNLNTSVDVATVQSKALRIQGQEEETIKDATLGFVGDLTELKPTLGYKVQMADADEIPLDGKLFNTSYKSIGLSEGWNWIGYPLAHEMEIVQALEHFTPEEGDYIIGQDDFTQYADGAWVGTLATLTPGLGYLYKSGSTKQMFFNATATLSSRVETKRRAAATGSPWTCDKRKYPNVMAMTACLYNQGIVEDADDYYVAAFCGNECRGVGKAVKGLVMMNVYGQGNETIQFKAIDKETEQLVDIAENTPFSAEVQGSIAAPFRLTIGDDAATDIASHSASQIKITPAVIRNTMTVEVGSERIDRLTVTGMNGAVVASWKKLPSGSTVDVAGLSAGVYVVTVKAGKQVLTKKIMKVSD